MPTRLSEGKTAIINGNVYCGGGATDNHDNDQYIVYCYDPSQDKWTTLPPLPVYWFGLGQVNGEVVAIGGKKSSFRASNEVYTYDERSQKWKQTIPPMPTARRSPGVLSLQSALVVAGGSTSAYSATVEIFKSDTSEWSRTDPLPRVCRNISLAAIGNTCYAIGGYHDSHLSQALYASIDDLLGNAVPPSQTTHSGSGDTCTRSSWKILPNTPTCQPAAAMLAGNLLGIEKEICMYSSSTDSWIHISDLPAPRSLTAVAVLSSTEILVIGGWYGGRVNTVYKGTLTLS